MKARIILGTLLTISLFSANSFADNRYFSNHQSLTTFSTNRHVPTMVMRSNHVSPVNVVTIQPAVGHYAAKRVNRKNAARFYQARFEQRWGKDWKKKYNYKTVVVNYGDTLSKIAYRYNTTVSKLMRLNRMTISDANHIEVGQILRIS